MPDCAACGHALEAHLKGDSNNVACPCCQWQEPWEMPVATPVDYATNPFYALDEDMRTSDRQE